MPSLPVQGAPRKTLRWQNLLFTSGRRYAHPFSERGWTHHSLIVEEDTKGEPRHPRIHLTPIARAREPRVASGASSSGPPTASREFRVFLSARDGGTTASDAASRRASTPHTASIRTRAMRPARVVTCCAAFAPRVARDASAAGVRAPGKRWGKNPPRALGLRSSLSRPRISTSRRYPAPSRRSRHLPPRTER